MKNKNGKVRLKQGTLAWETARETRIGGSEVFDIIRYYATETELQNCGLNAEELRAEKPNTTAWALYHKIKADGLYHKGMLPPELAEYGHAMEAYGASILQQGRQLKLKLGEVFIHNRLIASLDISGVAEEIDIRPFDYGEGTVKPGMSFACEQKTMMPIVAKKSLPLKYIIQAQYQIMLTRKDFFILQTMVLDNDTVFERGKITQLANQSLKKLQSYLTGKVNVTHLYFANNERLAALIKTCLQRFFECVDCNVEPNPFIVHDSKKNIIESIRINSFYNKDAVLPYDLTKYIQAKKTFDDSEQLKLEALQEIVEAAKLHNVCRFSSDDGTTASFNAIGAFLVKEPKEDYEQNQSI